MKLRLSAVLLYELGASWLLLAPVKVANYLLSRLKLQTFMTLDKGYLLLLRGKWRIEEIKHLALEGGKDLKSLWNHSGACGHNHSSETGDPAGPHQPYLNLNPVLNKIKNLKSALNITELPGPHQLVQILNSVLKITKLLAMGWLTTWTIRLPLVY